MVLILSRINSNISCEQSLVTQVKYSYVKSIHFGSTAQYNTRRKTIRFNLAVSPVEHRRYNSTYTLYNNFYGIQTCGG